MEDLNIPEIRRLLTNSSELDRQYIDQENSVFSRAKTDLLNQFDEHPVTQELLEGPEATNISGTLSGTGNLFSFIGFPAGSTPIISLREILVQKLTISSPTKTPTADGWKYRFPIYVPLEEITEATPLPFEVGNSWVTGIEQGISGFSNFLYRVSKASRSGKGIETKAVVRSGEFSTRPYLLSMLKSFISGLSDNNSFTFDL